MLLSDMFVTLPLSSLMFHSLPQLTLIRAPCLSQQPLHSLSLILTYHSFSFWAHSISNASYICIITLSASFHEFFSLLLIASALEPQSSPVYVPRPHYRPPKYILKSSIHRIRPSSTIFPIFHWLYFRHPWLHDQHNIKTALSFVRHVL
jgi:hypothetical protein